MSPFAALLAILPAAALAPVEVFWATSTNCPPCREFEPILRALLKEGYDIRQIDIEKEAKAAEFWKIDRTPTVVFHRGNTEIGRLIGLRSRESLLAAFQQYGVLKKGETAAPCCPGGVCPVKPVPILQVAGLSLPLQKPPQRQPDPPDIETVLYLHLPPDKPLDVFLEIPTDKPER